MTSANNVYRGIYLGPPKGIVKHHGILGQKWGVRRFQNADGSLTPAGRERYLASGGKLTEAGNKAFYDKRGNLNAAGRAYEKYKQSKQPVKELTPEEREARKQEAINSGDIEKVSALRHEMSQAEMKAALDRIDMYAKIDKVRNSKQVDEGEAAMEKAMKALNTTVNIAGTAMKAWESYDSLKSKMKAKEEKAKLKPIEKAIKEENWDYVFENLKDIPTSKLKDFADRYASTKKLRDTKNEIAEALDRERVKRAKEERDFLWFAQNKDKTTSNDINELAKLLAADDNLSRIKNTKDVSDETITRKLKEYSTAKDYESLINYMSGLSDEKQAKFADTTNKASKIAKFFGGDLSDKDKDKDKDDDD